ncbi:MAG: hypothetical protein ABSH09_25780 [Bryobacteraceae bacterium]|jgi:hypothetical protein
MRIKLDKGWSKRLRELPESGMGYQRVDVRFTDGRELKNAVVLNGEELEVPNDFGQVEVTDVGLHKA